MKTLNTLLCLIAMIPMACSSVEKESDREPAGGLRTFGLYPCDGGPCGTSPQSDSSTFVDGTQADTIFLTLENETQTGPHMDTFGGETYHVIRKNSKVTCERTIRWSKAGDRSEPASISTRCRGDFK